MGVKKKNEGFAAPPPLWPVRGAHPCSCEVVLRSGRQANSKGEQSLTGQWQGKKEGRKWDCSVLKVNEGASLVAQWLGVRLPMRGTRVRAPVWEDPPCREAAGPVSHGC